MTLTLAQARTILDKTLGAAREKKLKPLGVAVVGGLAFSQLITLYVTPVVYTYMDTVSHRAGAWLSRFGKKKRERDVVLAPGGLPAMEPRVVAKSASTRRQPRCASASARPRTRNEPR